MVILATYTINAKVKLPKSALRLINVSGANVRKLQPRAGTCTGAFLFSSSGCREP
jgi:hypothetical protein